MGLYIIVVAVRAWKPDAGRRSVDPRWGHLSAWLIGVIEVMFATAGPVVVAWLQMRALDVQSLRASVPIVMVLAGSVAVAVLFGFGQTEWTVIAPRWLVALPIALAGVAIRNRIAARIPPLQMKRVLSMLLAVSGLALMRHVLA